MNMTRQFIKFGFIAILTILAYSCEKAAITPWISFPYSNGISVQSIAIDANNYKWFGTWDKGIVRFDGINWATYTNNGLIHGAGSIAIDVQNNKWFGGAVPGVIKFDGNNWTTYNTSNSGLSNDTVSCIAIDSKDSKWFGTLGGGVSKFEDGNWTSYTTNNGLVNNYVTAIAIDAQGNKWVGTTGGVSEFDGTKWTNYTTDNGLKYNYITAIAIDSRGNIWVAPSAIIAYPPYAHIGVMQFDGKKWTYSNSPAEYDVILSIAIDALDNKWFGTDNGVIKFVGKNWTAFNYNNSVLTGAYYPAIAVNKQQNIWCGTMSAIGGIFELENY